MSKRFSLETNSSTACFTFTVKPYVAVSICSPWGFVTFPIIRILTYALPFFVILTDTGGTQRGFILEEYQRYGRGDGCSRRRCSPLTF